MQRTPLVWAILFLLAATFPTIEGGTVTDNSPGAGLRRYREDFNSLPLGSPPCNSAADAVWCLVNTTGTGTQLVNTAPSGLAGQSWAVTDSSVAYAVQFRNLGLGVDACASGQSLSFSGQVGDLSLNEIQEYTMAATTVATTQGPPDSAFIRFTGQVGTTNTVNYGVRGTTGAETLSASGSIVAGATFTMIIAQVNCSGFASAQFTDTGITSLGPTVTVGPAASGITGPLNRLRLAKVAAASGVTAYLDDYDWQGAPLPTPTISGFTPGGGNSFGGDSINVTGTNYEAGVQVIVDTNVACQGGTNATTALISTTELRFTTPPHAAGSVNICVMNPSGAYAVAAGFVYQGAAQPTPFITNLSPNFGSSNGGNNITINGGNFNTSVVVTVGGQPATYTRLSNTQITVTMPGGTVGQSIEVRITNPDTQTASAFYTYVAPGQTTPPATDAGGFGAGIPVSAQANSGRTPDIETFGDHVYIAHTGGAGNALLVSHSADQGATWEEFQTGTTGNYSRIAIAVRNTTEFAVVACRDTGLAALRTTDGGQTWLTFTQVGPNYLSRCDVTSNATNFLAAFGTHGSGILLFNSSTNPTWVNYASINNPGSGAGVGFATKHTGLSFARISDTRFRLAGDGPTDFAGGGVARAYVWDSHDGGVTWSSSNGVIDTGQAQDQSTPLSDYGYGTRISPDGKYLTFKTVAGQLYVANNYTAASWAFYPLTATNSTFAGLANCGVNADFAYRPTTNGTQVQYGQIVPSTTASDGLHAPITAAAVAGNHSGVYSPSIANSGTRDYVAYQDNATGKLAVVIRTACATSLNETPDLGPILDPVAQLNLTAIDRFDIDDLGEFGVIRYNGGNDLKGLNAGPMTTSTATATPDCDTAVGGAFIQRGERGTNVLYSVCDNNPTSVNSLHLRSATLGNPDKPAGCIGGFNIDFCDIDLDDGELATPEDDTTQIAQLNAFPTDFSRKAGSTNIQSVCGQTCVFFSAWGFKTNDGRVGAVSYSWRDQADDKSDYDFATIDASAGDDLLLCTARFGGEDLLYGAAPNGGVKAFKVSYTFSTPTGSGIQQLDVELLPTGLVPGTRASSPVAIACGGGLLAVARANGEMLLYNQATPGTPPLVVREAGAGIAFGNTLAIDPKGQILVGRFAVDDSFIAWDVGVQGNATVLGRFDFFDSSPYVNTQLTKDAVWTATEEMAVRFDITSLAANAPGGGLGFEYLSDQECDVDADGFGCDSDGDVDSDGIPNSRDVDVDGDGICNGGEPSYPASSTTEGAEFGCDGLDAGETPCTGPNTPPGCAGDWDDDDDGLPNARDPYPSGCTTACDPASGSTGGPNAKATPTQGLFNLSLKTSLYASLALILGLVAAGYTFTVGRRNRNG